MNEEMRLKIEMLDMHRIILQVGKERKRLSIYWLQSCLRINADAIQLGRQTKARSAKGTQSDGHAYD